MQLRRFHSVSSERIEDRFAKSRRVALASSRNVYDTPSNQRDRRIMTISQPKFAQSLLERGHYRVNLVRPEGR
jgi:hypothetical protein